LGKELAFCRFMSASTPDHKKALLSYDLLHNQNLELLATARQTAESYLWHGPDFQVQTQRGFPQPVRTLESNTTRLSPYTTSFIKTSFSSGQPLVTSFAFTLLPTIILPFFYLTLPSMTTPAA
jgi:hypothetical protein